MFACNTRSFAWLLLHQLLDVAPRPRVDDLLRADPRAPRLSDTEAHVRELVGAVRIGRDHDHDAGLSRRQTELALVELLEPMLEAE